MAMFDGSLVIVDNLNLPCVAIAPDETNAPLLVDANAMLPKSVATRSFEPVAGRDPQIIEASGRVDRNQFGPSPLLDLHGQPANGIACEDGRNAFTGKALDHSIT